MGAKKHMHIVKQNVSGSCWGQQDPSGFCFHIKGDVGAAVTVTYTKPSENDGVVELFISCLVELVKWLYNKY